LALDLNKLIWILGLSSDQFDLIGTVFSLAIGVMGIAGLFFFLQRSEVLPRYRTSMTLLCLVSVIATYNYVRLYSSWHESFVVLNGVITSTGVPYNDTFRYADWLTTVPLLLVAFVSVLDLPARLIRLRSTVLALLGAEMIALGYFGQVATNIETRWVWFGVGMIPFIIIMVQLYSNLGKAIEAEPAGAGGDQAGQAWPPVVLAHLRHRLCPPAHWPQGLDGVRRHPGRLCRCRHHCKSVLRPLHLAGRDGQVCSRYRNTGLAASVGAQRECLIGPGGARHPAQAGKRRVYVPIVSTSRARVYARG